ncbi:MAG: hypothetical protein Q7S68_03005 [Deltaproteobacteria bacterium]|nr:hypothetical protein [Deltaproteobacteria bacterium]
MKKIQQLVVVALLFVATSAAAATLDGNYTFASRAKNGAPDMQGWTGTMTIQNDTVARTYKSVDGKETKAYTAALKQEGDVYNFTITKSYKPEQVGTIHKNKITTAGKTLTIESADGVFKEVWAKK